MTPDNRTPVSVKVAGGAALIAALVMATTLISNFEGIRTHAYRDQVGVPTICMGHTEGVEMGQTSTRTACMDLLQTDVRKYASGVLPCIHVPTVPIASLAAYISFSYNVGTKAFCSSAVVRRLNAGDLAGSCAAMDQWVYAGGKRNQGLVNRRRAERAYCERGLG